MRWDAWRRQWPLLPALAAAGYLRLAGLGGTLYGDPAEYTAVARNLAADPRDLAYPDLEHLGPAPFVSQPPLALYLFALGIRLTGSVEVGPAAVSAILGTATVALVYALGALLHSRWTGAAAAAFLAVLPFHVRASREALLDTPFAFFLAAAVLAFAWWWRRPSDGRAWLLGAALAGAALSKLPGPLALAVVFAGAVAAAIALRGQRDRLRQTARHAAITLAPTALLAALYLGLLWMLRSTADLVGKTAWQAGRVAGEDTATRPWHWYFTELSVGLPAQAGFPLLLLAVAGLCLVAAQAASARHRQDRPALVAVLAWPVLLTAFLVLAQRKEWFYAIPLNPALALLAAWPVGAAVRWVSDHGDPRPARPAPAMPAGRRVGAVAMAALSVSAALWAPVAATSAGPGTYGAGVWEAGDWIHGRDPEAGLVGTTLGRFTLHLATGQPTYHSWLNHTFVEDSIAAGRTRYVVIDPYASEPQESAWLRDLASGGRLVWEHGAGPGAVQVWQVAPGP